MQHNYDAIVFIQHAGHINFALDKNNQAMGTGRNPLLIAVGVDREVVQSQTIYPLCFADNTEEALTHMRDLLGHYGTTVGHRIVALADKPDDKVTNALSHADTRIRVAYPVKAARLRP